MGLATVLPQNGRRRLRERTGQVLLLTTVAGAAIVVGGAIAMVEKISPRWIEREFRHSVIALGGGVCTLAYSTSRTGSKSVECVLQLACNQKGHNDDQNESADIDVLQKSRSN